MSFLLWVLQLIAGWLGLPSVYHSLDASVRALVSWVVS
jgi:hypothetical protein